MSSPAPLFTIPTVSGLQSSGKEMRFSAPNGTLNSGERQIFCDLDIAKKLFCWDSWVCAIYLGCAFKE